MSDATMFQDRATMAAHRLAPKLWVLAWIGLLLLVPGLLVPDATIALAFSVSATTLFVLAFAITGLNRRYLASTRH
ncbi:MAG: hypothetical protein KDK00_07045, partial [Rhodobacteraceae bacterium]|nr:hypothetical protein [Paracoccaceae bacterium]